MILVIDALNQDRFADVLDEMFQLRARVFGDRMGWDVQITDGRECDQFDDLNPAYGVGLDDDGNVISCVRALQTTGPHMLSDVFHNILDGEPPLRSATIWESTRFCVDTQRLARDGQMAAVSRATCEMIIGALEHAKNSGITDIVTVIDPVMNRILKRSNCAPYDYLGKTTPMGKVAAMAALLDCTEARISALRDFAGITGEVFIGDDDARALRDARKMRNATSAPVAAEKTVDPTQSEIVAYCRAQMDAAHNEEERVAAQRLVDHLVKHGLHPAQ